MKANKTFHAALVACLALCCSTALAATRPRSTALNNRSPAAPFGPGCPNDEFCSNGLFCDGEEICDPVTGCEPGSEPCPKLFCDEETDSCGKCQSDDDCDDGAICNGFETCVDGSCEPGPPFECNDDIACTIDTCDPVDNTCVFTPSDASCDDGLYCNGVETCDPFAGCQPGLDPCPGLPCDEETNQCATKCLSDDDCDDGEICNGFETCVDASCQPGPPFECNDDNTCTIDTCDPVNNVCVFTPSDALCNDGLYCNGVETCDPLAGCQPGTPPDCDDGVVCTIDSCNESTDSCDHEPDDGACDDGLFCNGVEMCDPINGCQAGTPPNCADSVPCTVDTCNEMTDSCDRTPQDSLCQNSLFCDGMEVCDPDMGCVDGPDPNCNDGVVCTVDACDEVADMCTYVPNNAVCDDGLFCNGAETCDPIQGCSPGTPPDCDDPIVCTDDSCDEVTDTCIHIPDDDNCDDGDPCTDNVCGPSGCTGVPTCGACCYPNGTCQDGQGADACIGNGVFHGVGSACLGDDNGDGADDLCPVGDQIPTVSTWGLLVLTLLLLALAKVRFGYPVLARSRG